MKRVKFFALSLVLVLMPFFSAGSVFANANDFYFKDFTADYYLKKRSDNTSELEVVEEMTAVFPNYNQNHGIERRIPFLNQNDTNLTMESTDNLEIEVTRNGVRENATVTAHETYFNVRIGDPDVYLHGEQTYVLKYKFIHVITAFEASKYSENAYQELYWDSNGVDWDQSFNKVTVNLHMENEIYDSLKTDLSLSKTPSYQNKALIHENNTTKDKLAAWCYVGKKKESNQDRCMISDLSDGISFTTGNLAAGENLTFVTNFDEGTFEVPENDFIKEMEIKEAEVDYYLTRDEDGLSHVKVKEKITTDFPTLNEVYAFSRHIYYVNNPRNNFITDRQDGIDINVTMDGEPIDFSIINETDDGRYVIVATNDSDEYFHGEHTFTYEYELKNVITAHSQAVEKDSSETLKYQDFRITNFPLLLSDTEKMVVNVHLSDDLKSELVKIREGKTKEEKLNAVCNDGSGKEITMMGCTVRETEDGFSFSTADLPEERVFITTVHFKEDTFTIPEPNRNYLYYFIFGAVFTFLAIIVTIFYFRNVRPVKDRIKYLKNQSVAPQYAPLKGYTAAQLASAYVKPTKNPKVATMLELIIQKKVELIKGEKKPFSKKYNWKVRFVDLTGLSKEQIDLLKILGKGRVPTTGYETDLTSHAYSATIDRAFQTYDEHIKDVLVKAGWLEKEKKSKSSHEKYKPGIIIFTIALIIFILMWIFPNGITLDFETFLKAINFTPFSVYEGKWLHTPMILMTLAVFAILPILSIYLARYKSRTEAGLDVSNYMEGLKLYIKMAEADRLKFLQSVEGVDTSKEGIVKLNEKLLPYAALFGLEKSWMAELEKYYELSDETSPDWYAAGFNYAMINSTMRSAVSRPIDTSSSGFDGGSSGSSGGGGDGFSGGGGGGGGGGGW